MGLRRTDPDIALGFPLGVFLVFARAVQCKIPGGLLIGLTDRSWHAVQAISNSPSSCFLKFRTYYLQQQHIIAKYTTAEGLSLVLTLLNIILIGPV